MAPKKNLLENYSDGNLDLSLSGIQEVPVKDILAIPKAKNLDLSSNNIVSLPKSFATSLARLVTLDLSKNQLTSLPENFGLLVNLKHLDLYNNKIESLPLSFGNLKSLQWLDLKSNPLMPKLAQIAGDCLDDKQCKAAAKNVVSTLRATQDQVNAEIERRKEVQLKKMEKVEDNNVVNQNKETQKSKKKKKKAASAVSNDNATNHANGKMHTNDGESEKDSVKDHSGSSVSVPSAKPAQKRSLLKKVIRVLSSTVKVIVMTALFLTLCGFLLSLFDEGLYKSLQLKASAAIRANLPKQYVKQFEDGLAVSRRAIVMWSTQLIAVTTDLFARAQRFLSALSDDQRVRQYLENIQSGWLIIWIWLNEKYSALCIHVPHMFGAIKRTFLEAFASKS